MYPVTQDFLDKMKADRRRVRGRVTIDYTDPAIDQSITASSSEEANVSWPGQTADGLTEATAKWFSLDGSSKLDGTYRLAPETEESAKTLQMGWWGSQLAGASGLSVLYHEGSEPKEPWELYYTNWGTGLSVSASKEVDHLLAAIEGHGTTGEATAVWLYGGFEGLVDMTGRDTLFVDWDWQITNYQMGALGLEVGVLVYNPVTEEEVYHARMSNQFGRIVEEIDVSGIEGECQLDIWCYVFVPEEVSWSDSAIMRIYGVWLDEPVEDEKAFSPPYPQLTITHVARPIYSLAVSGDSARGEYPVDFTVKLYNEADELLRTETVTDNDGVHWSLDLDAPVLDVVRQVLEITKWSHEGRQVKILEFFTSIQETYEADDLLLISLLEEREVARGTLPVGSISANELTVRLNNIDRRFDPGNPSSPLHNLVKANRRIRAWLGISIET